MSRLTGPGKRDAEIGARIRTRRLALGFGQADLGRAIGSTPQQVSKYELGQDQLPASVLAKLAAALGCTSASLIGEVVAETIDSLAEQLATPGALDVIAAYASLTIEARKAALCELKAIFKAE